MKKRQGRKSVMVASVALAGLSTWILGLISDGYLDNQSENRMVVLAEEPTFLTDSFEESTEPETEASEGDAKLQEDTEPENSVYSFKITSQEIEGVTDTPTPADMTAEEAAVAAFGYIEKIFQVKLPREGEDPIQVDASIETLIERWWNGLITLPGEGTPSYGYTLDAVTGEVVNLGAFAPLDLTAKKEAVFSVDDLMDITDENYWKDKINEIHQQRGFPYPGKLGTVEIKNYTRSHITLKAVYKGDSGEKPYWFHFDYLTREPKLISQLDINENT